MASATGFNMSRIKKYDFENHIHFLSGNVYHHQKIFAKHLPSKQYSTGKRGWIQVHYNDAFCNEFINNLEFYRDKFEFKLIAYVIMPDHYHLLILPRGDSSLADFRQSFKGYTAHQILEIIKTEWDSQYLNRFKATESVKRKKDPQYHIFQADDYDFNIFTDEKLIEKFNYIHNNPVKDKLVEFACDYKYSSARNYELNDDSLIRIDRIENLW